MKKGLFLVFIFLVQYVNAFEFPKINSWSGAPIIEFQKTEVSQKSEDKFSRSHSVVLKKGYEFKAPFAVVTASRDFLRLGIQGQSTLEILPKSKMQMPYLHPPAEDEDIKSMNYHILLIDGYFHYSSKQQPINQIKIETAFFNLVMPKGIDLFIDIDLKIPAVTLSVLAGSLNVNFYDHEKKITLKPNQKITFTGVKNQDGSVQYDYLLDHRKAPKGKLGTVQKTTSSQAYSIMKDFLSKEDRLRKKEAEQKAKKEKFDQDTFICKEPKAKRDQCFWKMIDGICYRFRCNASGEWAEKTERPFSDAVSKKLCSDNKAMPAQCDY